uniref:FAD/NAD(P)-binding domain-containing protein n=1 Tax=Triticum urartu TaxID=4572 RepID=A0A8R7U5X6_TRIUA
MIHYRSAVGTNLDGNGDLMVDYDYLVLALGVTVNTFNTPGVMEHCHFLKVVEDAQKIRKSVIDCFEKASLPNLSEEEKRKILHFVIIGGGPTGVEFAVELHDFLVKDLVSYILQLKKTLNSYLRSASSSFSLLNRRQLIWPCSRPRPERVGDGGCSWCTMAIPTTTGICNLLDFFATPTRPSSALSTYMHDFYDWNQIALTMCQTANIYLLDDP